MFASFMENDILIACKIQLAAAPI